MDCTTLPRASGNGTNEWADRCEYWLNSRRTIAKRRKRRERQTQPLILAGHGISITVEKGTLLIKDGNTHFPSSKSNHRYFRGDLNIPTRLILIDGSGAITLDAIDWLSEQKVDLIRLKWDGRIAGVNSANGYASDNRKVAWQVAARANAGKQIEFANPLIKSKIRETLFNLTNLLPPSPSREAAIRTARESLDQLKSKVPKSISKLLAIEGTVAQGYFFAWRALDIRWKELGRYPVPDEWKRFFSRSSLKSDTRPSNAQATHPINAMLNYAYALLEASIRIETIANGYDPSAGILHINNRDGRHSFVFDLMEPKRPIADRAILKLISEEKFSGADFMLQHDGVCRLNPELARHVANQVSYQLR